MSLESWKKEFYPKPPSKRMTKRQAIEHSLLKWTGLLPKNLDKHEVKVDWDIFAEVFDNEVDLYENVTIGASSCALCVNYEMNSCKKCPLYKTLGNVRCDEFGKYPYRIWRTTGDPRPMIRALKKTLKALEE